MAKKTTNGLFVTNTPLVPPPHLTKQTTRRDHALTKVTLTRSTYQQRVVWVETRTPNRVYPSTTHSTLTPIQTTLVHQTTTHVEHAHTTITPSHTQPFPITRHAHLETLQLNNNTTTHLITSTRILHTEQLNTHLATVVTVNSPTVTLVHQQQSIALQRHFMDPMVANPTLPYQPFLTQHTTIQQHHTPIVTAQPHHTTQVVAHTRYHAHTLVVDAIHLHASTVYVVHTYTPTLQHTQPPSPPVTPKHSLTTHTHSNTYRTHQLIHTVVT